MRLLTFDEVGPRDRERIGGKAEGLVHLAAEGLPVPPGFIISTEFFRAFLEQNDLWEAARAGAMDLSARILAGRLDPVFAGALRTAAARLGSRLAVRSSALDEDRVEGSFAGQYETVLGVSPGDQTEAAVLTCWASAHGTRARAYRQGRPLPPDGMAVIVQRLILPRCAGVMFTINPLTGSWREMTVEAAWGLGDSVVSGRVVPDFYRVRRPRRTPAPVQRLLARVKLAVEEDSVRPQQEMWALGSGGLELVAVPRARVGAPKLLQVDLLRLCRLGLRVEALRGAPQDLEWALGEDGRFYVLQARPVTTGEAVSRSGPVLWTRRFIGERWTEPATPLGWSLMRDLLQWFIAYPATSRRYLGGEAPSRLYRMAPYFNVTVFRHLAFKLPGLSPPAFMIELLPPDEAARWMRRRAQAPDLRVYASIFRETFAERRWERFRWNLFTNWKAWEEYERVLDAALAGKGAARLVGPIRDRGEARARAGALRALARDYIKVHICSLLFANIWYQIAQGVLFGEGKGDLVPDLLRAPGESWTLRTNHALWQLGRGDLALDAFLADFGHRATSSWEMFSPRYREEPERVGALARAAALHEDPLLLAAAAAERTAAARQRVSGLTGALVDLTGRFLTLREDQRYHFDRLLWAWKCVYLWLEGDLGLEIRFLESSELDALCDGGLARADAGALVARRREAWQDEVGRRAVGDEPPEFLVGDEVVSLPDTALRIQGLGISPGVVTGPVRVLRAPDQADLLRPGEILVARATDPGWTPLFLVAGGLVLEQGGTLSHGAVVAREYAIPAISNVPGATTRLRDGQVVTLDGGRGVVWIQ